jgi:hypothetical protein
MAILADRCSHGLGRVLPRLIRKAQKARVYSLCAMISCGTTVAAEPTAQMQHDLVRCTNSNYAEHAIPRIGV